MGEMRGFFAPAQNDSTLLCHRRTALIERSNIDKGSEMGKMISCGGR
jgi:flagellar basal body rod protein FlgG